MPADSLGVAITYEEAGEGQPVVWLPGLLDPGRSARRQVGARFRVAATWRYARPDGAGHGMRLDAPDEIERPRLDFLPIGAAR